jgi:hypothetical protein
MLVKPMMNPRTPSAIVDDFMDEITFMMTALLCVSNEWIFYHP